MAPSLSQLLQIRDLPQVRAALDTIAWAEGGRSYNTLYGGGTFSGNQHPNQAITAGGYTSTAAGRYQFLSSTWAGIKRKLGLADFGPVNQDVGAIYLIWERGQLDNLTAGNFEAMCRGLGCLWAALPYATCGQTRRPIADTLQYFNGALAVYGGVVPPNASIAAVASSNSDEWAAVLFGLAILLLI